MEQLEERCLLAVDAKFVSAAELIEASSLPHLPDEDVVYVSRDDNSSTLPVIGGGRGGNQHESGLVQSWVFQGGAPVTGGQTEPGTTPNKQVTGAIHTVLAHPTNADILYVGAVNGGIWKTTNATATNPVWVPQTDFQQSLSTGAMSFDRTDATHNTLLAAIGNWSSFGSSGGARTGVLRTTDGGTTWSNPGSVGLVGKNLSGIAGRGSIIVASSTTSGLMRSTNGGATFTAITSADFTSSNRFLDLVEDVSDPTGQRLYTSCEDKGIYRSDDFGATWVKITGAGINAEMQTLLTNTSNNNTEMTVHPTTGRLYVAVLVSGQARGIFYTNNGTAGSPTWTRMDVPILPQGSGVAISNVSGLGISPITITSTNHDLSTGDSVVINGVTGNTAANGLFWITNIDANTFSLSGTTGNGNWTGGGSWTKVTSPNPSVKDIDSEAGSQGAIHFSILVDPTDENILYVGGDRQDFPNQIGASDYSGAIFRGDTRLARNPNVAPSPQWDHMTADVVGIDPSGGTANGTGPHADSREMAYAADGRLIEVDDGGIFARTSPRNNTGNWFSMASNLGTVEYHSIAYDTNSNVIIGGTQDNGTQVQRSFGNTTWDALSTADGGAVAVDTISQVAQQRSVRFSSFQNLGSFRRTVYNASNGLVSSVFPALTVTSGAAMSKQFYTPVVVNNIDGSRLLFGASNGVYESFNQGDTVAAAGTNAIAVGSRGNVIDYGGRLGGIDNEAVAYVAGSSGVYVRTTAGGPFVATNPPGAGSILSVKMDPDDWQTAFAMDSSRVFMTTNAGGSWTNITGDVGSVGATGFSSLEYVGGVVDAVLLGTSLGVYATLLSSVGTWVKVGSGLPNAPVWDMDYDPADDVLVAGTLGRGAWSLSNVSMELRGPGVELTESGDATMIVEAGVTDTYDIALATDPTGPVEITVTADSQSEVSLDGVNFAASQIFARTDTAAQTITVRAIDDGLSEGLHTSTISHAITGTVVDPGYPLSLQINSIVANVADNELAPFERVAPLGGLISVSDRNSGILVSATSQADFHFVAESGQIIVASVAPLSNVLLSIELVGVSGTFTSAMAGEAVVLPATALAADGTYTVRVTTDGATGFDLSAFLNTAVEVNDTASGNELAIDDSFISMGSGRYGVVGESEAVVSSTVSFTKTNNPGQFIDISATGAPLSLGDDNEANITTTVGNSIFPAGTVRVGNNGGIMAASSGDLPPANAALPTAFLGRALLPFWDDIDSETGNVYWEERLVGGINTLIVQWENRPHYGIGTPVGNATFQLQLFASGPVLARFAYQDVVFGNTSYNFGASATIGYQESSTSALQFSFNTASIANGDVLDLAIPAAPDIDEYEIDLSGKAGQPIDILLAGDGGADFADQVFELLDSDGESVVATAVSDPVQGGSDSTNYDLGVLDFVVPHAGVYTVRVTSNIAGRYALVVTDRLSLDTEPNNAGSDPLRDVTATSAALGHLNVSNDQDDFYQIQLAQNEALTISTQTLFDSATSAPLNNLDPELEVIHPDGSTVVGTDLNSADGKNAQMTFSAPVAGTYWIRVRATAGSGEYLLQVAPNAIPPVVAIDTLVTNDSTPALSGTVEDPTATIRVDVGGQFDLAATNNGDGTWSLPDNTIAALADGTYDVAVRATDGAGNVGTDATTNELTVDTAAPILLSFTRQSPPTSPTDADTLVFRATFDEDVLNVDTSDFVVNGATTSTVTSVLPVSPDTYDVTVSGSDLSSFNGVVGLDLSGSQDIADALGHSLPPSEPGVDETFLVTNVPTDFGDAPAPYATQLADNGARHIATGPTLGTLRDGEPDGQPTPTADGDDANGGSSDEDGVVFGSIQVGQLGAAATISVQNAPLGAKLDAWIDFNSDGNWSGPGEQIFDSLLVNSGDNLLTFDVPVWAVDGTTFARFRLSSAGSLGPRGSAADGEVEDIILTIAPPAAGIGPFSARPQISDSATAVQSVVASDIDGDGDMDVVSASQDDDTIAWYENDGTETYTERLITTSADGANSVFVVDMDADGDLDVLASSQFDDTVAWYENDGSQVFTQRLVSNSAEQVICAIAADVDGDGDIDILSADSLENTIAWYENNGSQSFTERIVTTAALSVRSIFTSDVDSDGDLDVLGASFEDDTVAWYENDGNQVFTKRIITTSADAAQSVVASDIDGDGDMDVLSASPFDDTIAWYENNGDQVFSERVLSDAADSATRVFAADLDGDGDIDVLSTARSGVTLAWYENLGSQTFIAHAIASDPNGANDVVAADLDGDGDIDVLAASQNADTIVWYENLNKVLGDYNVNSTVDAADYVLWRKTLGTTGVPAYSGADGDGSGQIDELDHDVWRAHFGEALAVEAREANAEDGVPAAAGALSLAGGERRGGGALAARVTLQPWRSAQAAAAAVRDDALVAWLNTIASARRNSDAEEVAFRGDLPDSGTDSRAAFSTCDAAIAEVLASWL